MSALRASTSARRFKKLIRGASRSRCLLMVITQEAAQPLAALNRFVAADVRAPREQQDIALPLVIPLAVVMLDIFAQRSSQRALAKEDHLAQALVHGEFVNHKKRGGTGSFVSRHRTTVELDDSPAHTRCP